MRTQTLVQLSRELVERLDRRATASGTSRSALIRDLLERGLADERRAALGERLRAGYQAVPQVDAWGDLNAWSDRNARRNLAALAAEEDESWT